MGKIRQTLARNLNDPYRRGLINFGLTMAQGGSFAQAASSGMNQRDKMIAMREAAIRAKNAARSKAEKERAERLIKIAELRLKQKTQRQKNNLGIAQLNQKSSQFNSTHNLNKKKHLLDTELGRGGLNLKRSLGVAGLNLKRHLGNANLGLKKDLGYKRLDLDSRLGQGKLDLNKDILGTRKKELIARININDSKNKYLNERLGFEKDKFGVMSGHRDRTHSLDEKKYKLNKFRYNSDVKNKDRRFTLDEKKYQTNTTHKDRQHKLDERTQTFTEDKHKAKEKERQERIRKYKQINEKIHKGEMPTTGEIADAAAADDKAVGFYTGLLKSKTGSIPQGSYRTDPITHQTTHYPAVGQGMTVTPSGQVKNVEGYVDSVGQTEDVKNKSKATYKPIKYVDKDGTTKYTSDANVTSPDGNYVASKSSSQQIIDKETAKSNAAEITKINATASELSKLLPDYETLSGILDNANNLGNLSEVKTWISSAAASLGLSQDQITNMSDLALMNSLSTKLAMSLHNGGVMTDSDFERYQKAVPNPNLTIEGSRKILNDLKFKADMALREQQILTEWLKHPELGGVNQQFFTNLNEWRAKVAREGVVR